LIKKNNEYCSTQAWSDEGGGEIVLIRDESGGGENERENLKK
jgi:hypothetical protein